MGQITRYYQFNQKSSYPKYVEMTEADYLRAREEENRWFISFGTHVLECEENDYREFYCYVDHYHYSLRDHSGKRADVLSIEEYENSCTYGASVFAQSNEQSLEEKVIEQLYLEYRKQRILTALEQLTPTEMLLVMELAINEKKQNELAGKLEITQQAISQKYRRALMKLKVLLKDLEE